MSDQQDFDQMMVNRLIEEFEIVRRRWEWLVESQKECIKVMKQIKFDIHAINEKYAKINKPKSAI